MSDKNFKVKNGIDANGAVTITQPNTSTVPLTILANTLATGSNLLEVKRPDGSVRLSIGNDGAFSAQNLTAYNVRFYSAQTGSSGLIIRGLPSQTANLQEWRDINEAVLASVSASGSISAVDLTLSGNLTVNGTTTNLNSTNLVIEDKNIIIADVATPTDTTADGAGITIKGATDKTINWVQSTGSFTSSEPFIINTNNSARVAVIVKGVASQTQDLQQWRNTSESVIAKVANDGGISSISGGFFGTVSGPINSGNYLAVRPWAANHVPFTVKGFTAQTGDLTRWVDDSGVTLASINSNGGLFIKPISTTGNLLKFENTNNTFGWSVPANEANAIVFDVNRDPRIYWGSSMIWTMEGTPYSSVFRPYSADRYAMTIKGLSGQTADLQQWQTSTGTTLAKLDSSGNVTAADYRLSNSLYSVRKNIKKTINPAGAANANNTYDLFEMNFTSSLQGTFYIQVSIRGAGYGQNMTYSLPATYVMDWISQYGITNPFTDSTTWVDLTPLTFSPRHLMTTDYLKLQVRVSANIIYFRIKLTGTLTNTPLFDVYMQHSEEFANSTITELSSTGTDATVSNVMPNFLSSKAGFSAIFNPLTITASATGNIPLSVKSASGQSADLQQWQDSAGTVLAKIMSNGSLLVNSTGTSNDPITIQRASATRFKVDPYGNVFASALTAGNVVTSISGTTAGIYTTSASSIGLIIKAAASQTADLQQWQNSAGTILTKVDANGVITITNTSGAGAIFQANGAGGGYFSVGPYGAISTNGGLSSIGGSSLFGGYGGTSNVVVTVTGASGQTGDLQRWTTFGGTVLAKVDSLGNFTATSKSFDIAHPTKESMRLRYGSLEGPENGVYVRGTVESTIIELPDYWTGLVHADSITVSLTSVRSAQNIYVEKIENNKIYIGGNLEKAFFTVYGERKDIDNLTVEY